ncbi:single-stranded DNA binding protein [Campylobacter blaseri]|uniref:Single-stranded DNA-binding protein n=1 Tax=Campylobacter blaseri TaxID=2042961 RepID=A0A2P8R210_9BACT|nr:single-stranded DNA-binding protein [Campylobacter blaseri]PSM52531.1 single-stranded DNA-binding protein [Campylobacter blaseri]PSM54179.1 single-stranded DNA-binding protein [Campylobacter blaseri]QKF85829.1 single-stranded DNA binding protein [Campylobacter blaseri]
MYNKVILVGNLTRDIEVRYANNGSAIGNTAIATSRKFTTNGEKREEVCFVDITFFGRTAEVANQYLKKGSRILVEGRLKFDQWQDQNGNNRSKHSVVVESMQMLGSNDMQKTNPTTNSMTNQNSPYNSQNNNYGNQNSSYGSSNNPSNQSSYYNNQNSKYDNKFEESIPEVDIDDMGEDGDEILPF